MKLTLIAAIDPARLLCDSEGFLWHLPRDVTHFRQYTQAHPHLIAGRTTFEQMQGWFRPEHQVIVISSNPNFEIPPALGIRADQEVDAMHQAQQSGVNEWVCIGGGRTYEALLPYASDLMITHVEHSFKPRGKGTYFPKIDPELWRISHETLHEADAANAYDLRIVHYQRRI